MKFSLVMATVDRTAEIERFLFSLSQQSYRNFELIVVDQNQDDRLLPILSPYMDLWALIHIKTEARGAARARNLGLQYVNGDLIGFPDDDCWYPEELLQKLAAFFACYPEWDGLTGRATDLDGKTVGLHFEQRAGAVNRYNAWRRVSTFTMFLRSQTVQANEGFDEQLGVGTSTPWGAAEDTDYLIRLVDDRARVFYDPGLNVYHPDPRLVSEEKLLRRSYSYGCGMGKVMRKNNFPGYFLLYFLLRAIGGAFQGLLRGDLTQFLSYREAFRGRLYGWKNG